MHARHALAAAAAVVAALAAAPAASAFTGTLTGDELELRADAGGETIAVACTGASVTVNGQDAVPGGVACAAIASLELIGAGGPDTLDMSGVAADRFTQLTSARAFAEDGDDLVVGAAIDDDVLSGGPGDDRIVGGPGADALDGRDGDDVLVWNPGDGSDQLEGGRGTDTVEVNGGGAGEQFTVAPEGDGITFRRTAPGPFALAAVDTERVDLRAAGGDDAFAPAPGLAGLVDVVVDGGEGQDRLDGSDGADIIDGGPGDDRIAGFRGNDTLAGGPGDDVSTWNPGDGSDRFDGGAGRDLQQVNGGGAAEDMSVHPNGDRVTFVRTSGGPFFVDLTAAERLQVAAAGGDDRLRAFDGVGALIEVALDAGEGADRVEARDGAPTLIACGAQADTVVADEGDVTGADCEAVDRGGQGAPPPPPPAPPAPPPAPSAPPVVVRPAPDTTAPRMRVIGRRVRIRRNTIPVRVACPAAEAICVGTVTLRLGRRSLGRAAFLLEGGTSRRLRVKLTRAGRRAVRSARTRRLAVTARIVARDHDRNRATRNVRLSARR